ncbi:MAG: DUF3179 domain-containing (seleno)protein, partial [Acidimicrobiales bacterium]
GPRLRAAAVVLVRAMVALSCGSSSDDADRGSAAAGGTDPAQADDAAQTDASGAPSEVEVIEEPEVADPSDEFVALSLEAKIDAFLADPNSNKGALVAQAMGESGDPRYGAWLLDLYRLGRSTRIDSAAAQAFAELSGIETVGQRTDDYRNYGNWVYNGGVDPGQGYRDWKLGVYGSIDEEFSTLLARTPDDIVLSQIQWGGVTRGGIPELNQPARVAASTADWMTEDELVLGVVIEGQAVAYPIRILGHHELANDEIAGIPVSMVYCTLCRSGLLFDRRIEGEVLDFQTSGLLIESNKIMVDRQTDTLWRHQTGIGLAGPLEGAELAQFPVLTTSWSEWIAEHPDSEVLDIPDPIFPDAATSPEQPAIAYSYEAGEAYRFYYEDPDVWFPVFDTPEIFDLKESVLGITDGTAELAVGVDALVEAGPQVFEVGELTVAAVPTSSGALVYDLAGSDRRGGSLDDVVEAGSERLRLDDGSTWDRVAVSQLFWFAWFGQHPSTDWWPQ